MINDFIVTLILIAYYIVTAIIGFTLNTYSKLNDELKRKLLHTIGFLSYGVFIYTYSSWIVSSIVSAVLGVGSFIFILILEKYFPRALSFFKEREKGEIKYTILMVYLSFTIATVISWGCLQTSLLGALAIYGWGFGDMAASLCGTYLGKIHFKLIPKKSLEGSIACFIVTFLVSLTILFIYKYSVTTVLLFSLGFALVGTLSELISKDGLDTLIMPIALLLFSFIIYLF